MRGRTIFLDGRIVKARTELVESLAPGIVKGKGVFETMRVYGGTIFAIDKHFERLERGLRLLHIRSPYSRPQLIRNLHETIRANSLREARIRLAVWKEGRQTRIAIVCQGIDDQWETKNLQGLKAVISTVKRNKTRYSHIKSLDYLCFRRAYLEAQRRGYDEAILLNNREQIVEGSRSNIFLVRDGVLYTPSVKCGCLNGITRRIVWQLAGQNRIPKKTDLIGVDEFRNIDEVFMTNSIIGVTPILSVGERMIGNGKTGPVTEMLREAYRTNVHSSCLAPAKSL